MELMHPLTKMSFLEIGVQKRGGERKREKIKKRKRRKENRESKREERIGE